MAGSLAMCTIFCYNGWIAGPVHNLLLVASEVKGEDKEYSPSEEKTDSKAEREADLRRNAIIELAKKNILEFCKHIQKQLTGKDYYSNDEDEETED